MLNIKDMEFGRLRAISPIKVVRTNWLWKCLCDPKLGGCGRIVCRLSTWLRRGSTKSCGCLRKDNARKLAHKVPRRSDVKDMIRMRELGFTYRALGRLFKLSPPRCCCLILRERPDLRRKRVCKQ